MPIKLTATQRDEIVALYVNERIGTTRLGAKYGVAPRTVALVLEARGIPRLGPHGLSGVSEKVGEILRLHTEGLSQLEIGRQLGVAQPTISRVLRKNGVPQSDRQASGRRHGNWKGGRYLNTGGYVLIHPSPDDGPTYGMLDGTGNVLEHRLVMARALGRALTDTETVHHKNGNRVDNRLENLQLRDGNHGKGQSARCRTCGSHDVEFAAL